MIDAAEILRNDEAVAFLDERGFRGPTVAFELGSGWGHFVDTTDVRATCAYEDIPGFGKSTVEGHAGHLVKGISNGREYLAMQGRLHHYEGHSLQRIGGTIAILHALGVRELVVTNAAGGVNAAYRVGDLVLVHDFINFMWASPIRGAVGSLNSRTRISERLTALVERAALEAGVPLRKGVLFASKGPTYETPAEVRMVRTLGGDLVGMSSAPELITASALGIEAIALSCVTNMAPGVVPGREVNHAEVIEVMESRKKRFSLLLAAVLERFEAERGARRVNAA